MSKRRIKVILLTPSLDLSVDLPRGDNELEKHALQIRELTARYGVGLADSYFLFKQLQINVAHLADYMAQSNHPNEKGYLLIAAAIIKYF